MVILLEAGPIGGDVSGVADRQAQPVRGCPEHVADLEGGAFLALDAVRVERVDQADGFFWVICTTRLRASSNEPSTWMTWAP